MYLLLRKIRNLINRDLLLATFVSSFVYGFFLNPFLLEVAGVQAYVVIYSIFNTSSNNRGHMQGGYDINSGTGMIKHYSSSKSS